MTANNNLSQNEDRLLSFSLGVEEYAIPLLAVREVIAMPSITPIPHTTKEFVGIMNLRGQVISILDLRTKLGIKPKDHSEAAVIICSVGESHLGLIVDSVNFVLNPKPSELSTKPDIQSARAEANITAIYRKEKSLILILDIEKTLKGEGKQDRVVKAAA